VVKEYLSNQINDEIVINEISVNDMELLEEAVTPMVTMMDVGLFCGGDCWGIWCTQLPKD
jgi:hypothetical protein